MLLTRKAPRRISKQHCLAFLLSAVLCAFACASPRQSAKIDSTHSATPALTPASTTSQAPKPGAAPKAATLEDIQKAVARVYQNTVAIDTSHSQPFVVGDFNGDGSQDFAVIVRPTSGSLPKLNSEYANWIVEDPRKMVSPDSKDTGQRLTKAPVPFMVAQDDVLLLVLHGYQQAGWQHEYARQSFLLKNVVGENIRVQPFQEAAKTTSEKSGMPQSGDVISESLGGRTGFIYWTNAKYVWHQ